MRRKTRKVSLGGVSIGGDSPVTVQSMTNTDTMDFAKTLAQVRALESAGCDIVRIAVPTEESASVFTYLKNSGVVIPLVADIHFDYRIALAAVSAGADKIRINPGNIGDDDRVRKVVKAAKSAGIPIRVGVNSGSLEKDIVRKNGGVTAEGLAESALRNVKRLEDMDFDDIVVSMKASDVRMNYEAHRIAAARTEHPFHIGITEAGTVRRGKIKSAAGIGGLLLAGIGDTVRVSLTADPVEEVVFARELLESLGIRKSRYDLVSCPTCGRTGIDLESLAEEVDRRLSAMENLPSGLKVAVMGCAVNGPGEAAEADFGCCGGDGKGLIIAKGKVSATVAENELAEELIRVIRENGGV